MFINADDFGYSKEVNKAIADLFMEKRINRTTIMVNMPFTEDARIEAFEKGFQKAVGLHINLTEGKALSPECAQSALCDENGVFKGVFHIPFKSRLYLDRKIRCAIRKETEAQVKKYLEMGFTLMHADSHNYTHSYISVWNEVKKVLDKYGFKSVRISRNIPKGSFSALFKIYKTFFNAMIKKYETTKYFGSVDDFKNSSDKVSIRESLELMTHPVYMDGVIIDNTLPAPQPFLTKEWIKEQKLDLEDMTSNKIKLLVTFIPAHIGGAMTSLVNFLNCIDTDKYDVDVLFYEVEGRWGIKEEINILPQAKVHNSYSAGNILKKALSPSYVVSKALDVYYKKIEKNKTAAVQIMSKQGYKYTPCLEKEYDVAIAYEYTWALNYTMHKVKAKKKLCWSHMDFDAAGLNYNIDRKSFKIADRIVFVSDNCREKFAKNHGEVSKKCCFLPNILTADYVRSRGDKEEVTLPFEDGENIIKFISVSRINFENKALDRAARVFFRLKNEGLLENVRWTIVGKGRDEDALRALIEKYGLKDYIFLTGLKENPIPYLKKSDALLLPSYNEGKPMVVTEALIMGVVPVVTEYTSAHEQIRNNVDGIILNNNEDDLFEGLKRIIQNPKILTDLRKNILNSNYGNEEDISCFYALAEELLKEG